MKKRSTASKICKQCGASFVKSPHLSYKQWEIRIYCSDICRQRAYTGFKHSQETRQYLSEFWLGRPKPWLVGDSNHFWRGGVYQQHRREKDRLMHSLAYKNWRRAVFKRDGYCCTECATTHNLHAHHIKPYRDFVELALEIDNGQTLCLECHKKTDSYGIK